MKILLFGEFSGLFNSLRDGLISIGHEVVMASDGNGFKNYPRDIDWYVNPNSKLGRFRHILELKKIYDQRDKLKGFDIVLVIHPYMFTRYRFAIKPVFDFLIKNNGKVFLSGAGMTPVVAKYWYNSSEKYHNYVAGNIQDVPLFQNWLKDGAESWEYELLEMINGYIPIWYEYAKPFKEHPKCCNTIRIPININKFEYKENIVKDKIVFFHGVPSRPHAKGTEIIKAAFEKMKNKYSEDAEFVCAGGLPFNEYMKIVEKANVILDDANSYSIAMNGLFSLAKGKIVMGGAEPIANEELGIINNPVYNLCPNVDQICSCIEDIINHKDDIVKKGANGRLFVENYHDYKDVATKYIETFENY